MADGSRAERGERATLLGFEDADRDRVEVRAGIARRTGARCDERFDLQKLPAELRPR